MSTKAIKICGLTQATDAQLAADLGAWALGFIFFANSRRAMTPTAAAALIQAVRASGKTPQMVGVFVNPSLTEVVEAAEEAALDLIQLHGDESAHFCQQVSARLPSLKIIKAFRPRKLEDLSVIVDYGALAGVLLETAVADAWGGTGIAGDWNLARAARAQVPQTQIILAGGLHPGNVAEAFAVAQPDAVDVCSGVEASAGIKSHLRMRQFFENAGGATK